MLFFIFLDFTPLYGLDPLKGKNGANRWIFLDAAIYSLLRTGSYSLAAAAALRFDPRCGLHLLDAAACPHRSPSPPRLPLLDKSPSDIVN